MRPLSGAILRVAEVHDVARVTDRPRAHSDLLLHAHALSQSICLGAAGPTPVSADHTRMNEVKITIMSLRPPPHQNAFWDRVQCGRVGPQNDGENEKARRVCRAGLCGRGVPSRRCLQLPDPFHPGQLCVTPLA